jgi:hypothetical protein
LATERALPLRSRVAWALVGLTLLGAALRFSTLGVQSYWYNEAATVVLVKMGLGDMLAHVPKMEGNPPLYYLLAWFWAKAFGTDEVGLRSLSAVIGTALIPVSYAVAARLVSRRAGLVVAALAACSPLLVWFSQEARPYVLLALLTALSMLYFLRALEAGGARAFVPWAVVSALALATHYFAVFIVGPEAIWLLFALRQRRAVVGAVSAVVAAGVALLPIALAQREPAKTSIPDSFGERIVQLPKQLLVAFGFYTPAERIAVVAAALLAVYGAWLALARTGPSERRGALIGGGLGAAAVIAVALLAAVGLDYLNTRNMIEAWLPFAVLVGGGLGASRSGTAGTVSAAVLCAVFVAAVVAVDVHRPFQRDDWRGAVRALGKPRGPRALVVTPSSGVVPLRVYLPRAHEARAPVVTVQEIDLVGIAQRASPGNEPQPPRPLTATPGAGFRPVAVRRDRMFTIVRLRAPAPVPLSPATLGGLHLGQIPPVVEVESS